MDQCKAKQMERAAADLAGIVFMDMRNSEDRYATLFPIHPSRKACHPALPLELSTRGNADRSSHVSH